MLLTVSFFLASFAVALKEQRALLAQKLAKNSRKQIEALLTFIDAICQYPKCHAFETKKSRRDILSHQMLFTLAHTPPEQRTIEPSD